MHCELAPKRPRLNSTSHLSPKSPTLFSTPLLIVIDKRIISNQSNPIAVLTNKLSSDATSSLQPRNERTNGQSSYLTCTMSGSQNEVDDVLRAWLSSTPSILGYVVVNSDGEGLWRRQRSRSEVASTVETLIVLFQGTDIPNAPRELTFSNVLIVPDVGRVRIGISTWSSL